jgi:hypothetical protein
MTSVTSVAWSLLLPVVMVGPEGLSPFGVWALAMPFGAWLNIAN